MSYERCMCGDTDCPWCGTARDTWTESVRRTADRMRRMQESGQPSEANEGNTPESDCHDLDRNPLSPHGQTGKRGE